MSKHQATGAAVLIAPERDWVAASGYRQHRRAGTMSTPLRLVAGDAVVDVDPAIGGRIAQITVDGRPLLRGPEDAAEGWIAWGWYPLLPWANRIPGGRARFGDTTIEVPVNWTDGTAIHGLVADVAWDVVDADERRVELAVDVAVDRYHVRGTQVITVSGEALELDLAVRNLADWSVPAGLGIHPWFRAAPVRVPADSIWDGDGPLPDGPVRPVRPEEDLRRSTEPEPMDRCFTGLTDTSASIGDLTLSWTGPITQVVVYTGEPGFVCVEPVTMANDGIRLADEGVEGTGVVDLQPGATLAVGYRLAWRPPR